MAIFLLTVKGEERSARTLQREPSAPKVVSLVYEEVLFSTCLPKATYIFTDIDRLSTPDRLEAARVFRRLAENGCRVLNDPAKVRTRFSLLRGLNNAGLNKINAYSPDEGPQNYEFPVFIRVGDGHDRPLSDLILNQTDLEMAIEAAVIAGIPRSSI